MPVTEEVFDRETERLVSRCEPGKPADFFEGWLKELTEAFLPAEDGTPPPAMFEWVTDDVFRGGVSLCVGHYDRMPTWHQFMDALRQASKTLADRQVSERLALPAPQRREVDEIDPTDPYSCTPEERRRWAEEDAWITKWAARIPESLPPYTPPQEVDAWQRDRSVAGWPKLTPAARRAKERRIAAERDAAIAMLTKKFGHPPKGLPPLQPQRVEWDTSRIAALEAKWYGTEPAAALVGEWPR